MVALNVPKDISYLFRIIQMLSRLLLHIGLAHHGHRDPDMTHPIICYLSGRMAW